MVRQLNLNFAVLAETGQRGVRRAAAFIGMAQKAWTDETITSATIDAPFRLQLLPDPMPKELADDVRSNFRTWVIGAAIAEIVQWLGRFADDFHEIATLAEYNGKQVPEDVPNRVRKCRTDTNLHSKLQRIVDVSKLELSLMEHTEGWTLARNCLAHNHGVVRERDLTPGTGLLRVRWKHFEFSIDGKTIDNIIGHHVEAGGVLGFRLVTTSKDFQVGEVISFSEQEILSICFTAHLQIDGCVKALEQYVGRFVEPKKT